MLKISTWFFYYKLVIIIKICYTKKGNIKLKLFSILSGIAVGVLNGLFGAGGGMVAVPLLKKNGLSEQSAHATSISVILPLSALSAFLYVKSGHVQFTEVLSYLPGGIIGAIVGALVLKKIPPKWLRKVFAGFMIYAAVRMLFFS